MKDEEKKVVVKLEKHKWPDEVEKIQEQKVKRNKQTLLVVVMTATILFSFISGYLTGMSNVGNPVSSDEARSDKEIAKFKNVLDILSDEWYFSSELDDARRQLIDQALYGVTTNEIDPHTTYLSSEELQSFTQGINMNFVGIGVQYSELDGDFIVERVFRNSPAERAGVQVGDIFNSVDGQSVSGMESQDLQDIVRGEKGSDVLIGFNRQGVIVEINITRDEVTGTAFGKMIDDSIGYLEITNFGETTASEVKTWLEDLSNSGMTKLIIDLRDNGGGYLTSLIDIAGFFIDSGEVAIQQKYNDGSTVSASAKGSRFEGIEEIAILVNENTASASEVLTMTLKEQRDDVTVVGAVTFGKGTVQATVPLFDGSALKYTTSEWLSPKGVSINGVGIVPDIEVADHGVFHEWITNEEEYRYELDMVGNEVKVMQLALDFLDYSVKRQDGYFDQSTKEALESFESKSNLEVDGILDSEVMNLLISAVIRDWKNNPEKDTQLQAAISVLED